MSEILCHIAGPSGCGKSSLMRRLEEKFPEFLFKDLDDFDDEVLGKKVASKDLMSNEEFNKFFDKKQTALDKFITGAKRPIVLVGIHTELPRKYEFLTLNKFLINCTAETAAFQALVSSKKGNETHSNHFVGTTDTLDLWQRKNQAQRDILWLCRQGYVIKANQEIENFLDSCKGNTK